MRLPVSLAALAGLAACVQVPVLPPAPGPVAPPAPPPEAAPEAGLDPTPDAGQMAASCRSAAAQRFGLSAASLSVSAAEATALGFVAFGQGTSAGGAPLSFECSFGPDGVLRVVRAA